MFAWPAGTLKHLKEVEALFWSSAPFMPIYKQSITRKTSFHALSSLKTLVGMLSSLNAL